jgi:glycine cleavage system H protein
MREYTKTHEWVETNQNIATIGLTKAAIEEIGEIVYIELPKVGSAITKGQDACVLESTKAAVDIASPVSGTIVKVNSNLNEINSAPEAEGWLFQVRL